MQRITINGREYTAEVARNDPNGRTVYSLKGIRGAEYFTMRSVAQPTDMFVVSKKLLSVTTHGLRDVWLTDRNGTLEVVR